MEETVTTDPKVLILQNGYFPSSNANIICSKHIADKLNEQGIPVDFFVYKQKPDEVDKQDGINNVFYITNKFNKAFYKYEKKGIPYTTLTKQKKLITVLFRNPFIMLTKIKSHFDLGSETLDKKQLLAKIKAEHAKQPYTHMVNICCPFGTMKWAHTIKKELPDIKWAMYMLDPFEYNYTVPTRKIGKRKKLFAKYTKGLDKLILTRGIDAEHQRCNYDNGHKNITLEVDLPNLKKPQHTISKAPKSDKTNLIYAGAFYKDIRNPDKMLEIFGKLPNPDIVFNIFGTAAGYITQSASNIDPRIALHGTKPHDEIVKQMVASNILVNLGNTAPNQLPSKVFEYIATGKPIANFYFNEHDTSLYYFKKYPLAFNINVMNYTDKDIAELGKFIHGNKDKQLTFEQATKDLHEALSENVCKKIVDAILCD